MNTEEKFWSHVKKSDGCWEWKGTKSDTGYGLFFIHQKKVKAHRVSWELNNGPIPKRMLVCHHCDNPLCVRPDHLFLGTQKDNMQDAVNKGRMKGFQKTKEITKDFRKITHKSIKQKRIRIDDYLFPPTIMDYLSRNW